MNAISPNFNFPKANPQELIQADADPKVLLMWPHGDEELGARIGEHIYNERPDLLKHVDYMCGNPKAAAQEPSVRYTESDLNRSFNPKGEPTTYEEKRAQEILERIEHGGYGFVLDVHTSTSDVDGFFLANRRNAAVDKIIAASPLTRIVMMPDDIANVALIGQVPNSISIEYDKRVAEERGVEDSIMMIDRLVGNEAFPENPQDREFFYVDDRILKTADPGEDARNFELCKDGYFPVLFGEKSYREDPNVPYLGFLATTKDTVRL